MSDSRSRLARAAWRTLTTREVYANPWIRLREDIAELPDGRTTLYGVVEVPPAIGVLPFLDERTVVLVGQYRYVARGFYWEMPTGGMKPGETEEAAAQRELTEEAGYEAGRLVKLCSFYSSKSVLDEVAHIYRADDLRRRHGVHRGPHVPAGRGAPHGGPLRDRRRDDRGRRPARRAAALTLIVAQARWRPSAPRRRPRAPR